MSNEQWVFMAEEYNKWVDEQPSFPPMDSTQKWIIRYEYNILHDDENHEDWDKFYDQT